MQTHETYIRKVAELAIRFGDLNPTERETLKAIKLVYGAGPSGTRGITYYNRWKPGNGETIVPFVEVCAFGQESLVQVCGTTIHELGHVLAGWNAGHSKDWISACARLGLGGIQAAGTNYQWECFADKLRKKLEGLPPPVDGNPQSLLSPAMVPGHLGGPGTKWATLKPCTAGIGTRGGTSRGVGSGSRLRLWECKCGIKVRIASDTFDATHNPCKSRFKQK